MNALLIFTIITGFEPESEHNERPVGPVDLDALRAGDNAAWEETFRHFWPIALASARRAGGGLTDPELEEVASDAITKLIERIEKITSAGHAEALVKLVARCGAVSLARKESACKRSRPDSPQVPPELVYSGGLSDMERSEVIVLLGRVLDVLEPATRSLLLERANGLTSQEISKKYGIPLGTVCTRVARALATARAQLQNYPSLMKELRNYLR